MNKNFVFYTPDNLIYPEMKAIYDCQKDKSTLTFHWPSTLTFIGQPHELKKIDQNELTRELGLWEHSCFELFIKNKNNEEYVELNFSPNQAKWNAFHFTNYRSPIKETKKITVTELSVGPTFVSIHFLKPSFEYSIHPKVILFRDLRNSPIYLSDFQHPKTGPDFHLFSTS